MLLGLLAPSAASLPIGPVLFSNGIIKFAVFKHFSPDTAVDAPAEMLDKLAVN